MTGYNAYPETRLRRLRGTDPLRNLARETRLSPKEFIYPMFVMHGHGVREPIEPMPGCHQVSLDVMSEEVGEAAELGIGGVLLFGLPAEKDALGTEGYDPEGIVQEAVRTIKRDHPDMMVCTDICMCEYTDHGHCGVIDKGRIDNDQTLELLARTAVTHVQAGADLPAPSAMMDGQVWAIRQALNAEGYEDTPIMGYAAKFASGFYGPFRVGRGLYSPVRRPQVVPDGPGQLAHGHARDRERHRRGRGHRHGQARHGLHGRHPRGPRALQSSAGRLQRQR